MTTTDITQNDSLQDFARRDVNLNDISKVVYVAGTGPAVIVMTEMPGISPHVARFARLALMVLYRPPKKAPLFLSEPALASNFAR
jgi:hypothetical protein